MDSNWQYWNIDRLLWEDMPLTMFDMQTSNRSIKLWTTNYTHEETKWGIYESKIHTALKCQQ